MIKNIKYLSHLELEELKTLYLEYFKEYDENELKGFARLVSKLSPRNNEVYTDEMINRVVNGDYVGFVVDDFHSLKGAEHQRIMTGFIIGHADLDKDTGWISHFYVEPEHVFMPEKYVMRYDTLHRKELALELYSAIAEEFKKMGKTKVMTELGAREYRLRDMLDSLDFAPVHDYDDGHEDYGRKL